MNRLDPPRRRSIGGHLAMLSVFAFVVLGCNQLVLRTAPAPAAACDGLLTGGQLVRSQESGLGLQVPGEAITPVTWPFGYRASGIIGSVELLDETGRVLAREGEFVEVGGGLHGDGSFLACAGTVRIKD